MKKFTPLIIIGVVVLMLFSWVTSSYNQIVTKDTEVEQYWSQVENNLQSRFDLMPNLIATVKGAANFEQETLTDITEARTKWLNASSREEQIAASQQADSALARLLVTVEAYPQLTATANFQTLQAQIEGIENRLRVARMDYVNSVGNYNLTVRRIPTNIIASMFGFEQKANFTAVNEAQTAPVVNFE